MAVPPNLPNSDLEKGFTVSQTITSRNRATWLLIQWPVNMKTKPDLIIFDPPYFSKKTKEYEEESISNLSKEAYLDFLEKFFRLAFENSKKGTRLVMINADWRDYSKNLF